MSKYTISGLCVKLKNVIYVGRAMNPLESLMEFFLQQSSLINYILLDFYGPI